MIRAATTLADPCTGAPRRDFRLGLRRGQLVGAHVPSWCSRHGWTLVAPDELARLASLQLVSYGNTDLPNLRGAAVAEILTALIDGCQQMGARGWMPGPARRRSRSWMVKSIRSPAC